MKKKLAIIAMIVLLCTALILCACDDTDNNGDGNVPSAACNCPNCHDGVCSCEQCKGDTTIPEINRAEVRIGKDATYYSGSDNQEFSATAYFVFEPKYTSDYTIAWDKNVAEIKINGTPITLGEEQKSVKHRLVGGQKYEIDASMGKFSLVEYPITLSVTPEDYQAEVSLTKGEEYIVRIPKSSDYKDVKRFTFGENVIINTVLKVNENGALVNTFAFELYELKKSKENMVDIPYGDADYFIVISSEQNTLHDFNINQAVYYTNSASAVVTPAVGITKYEFIVGNTTMVYNISAQGRVNFLQQLVNANAVGNTTVRLSRVFVPNVSKSTESGNWYNIDDENYIAKGQANNYSVTINCSYTSTKKVLGQLRWNITNALQLANIGSSECIVYLDSDIEIQPYYPNWTPIPTLSKNLYGNLHTIYGLKINIDDHPDKTNFGLVAVNNALIMGVYLEVDIRATDVVYGGTWINVGGFAGVNSSSGGVGLAIAYGTIVVNRSSSAIGGVAGRNSGGSLETANFGKPDAARSVIRGYGDVGGVAGVNENGGNIMSSAINVDIEQYVGDAGRSIGGVVGYCNGATIDTSSVDNCTIRNVGYDRNYNMQPKMGVIVGHITGSTFTDNTQEGCSTSIGSLSGSRAAYCFKGPQGLYGLSN